MLSPLSAAINLANAEYDPVAKLEAENPYMFKQSKFFLYDSDWSRFPTAIVDTKTSNKSFLEYSSLLKKMGIKNHLFPLVLLNPNLQGVDPFSKTLTVKQMTEIRVEVELNPWYFLREILRFAAKTGDMGPRVIANRANIALWWMFLNHIDAFLTQPRQTGKTVNVYGIHLYVDLFWAKNTRSSLLTTTGDNIIEATTDLKVMRKQLPAYLYQMTKEDSDNKTEFTHMAEKNRLRCAQSQGNPIAARRVGRGVTAPFIHINEAAFIRYAETTFISMLGGVGRVRRTAAELGMPYWTVYETTPGKLDDDDGKYCYDILMGGAPMNEAVYDCNSRREVYRMIGAASNIHSPLVRLVFNHRQLGYSDDWLKERIALTRGKGDEIRRDYLGEWTFGSQTNPLDPSIIELLKLGEMNPLYTQVYPNNKYSIYWYLPKEEVDRKLKDRCIIMGLDTSNAVGRDAISGVMIDTETLEVVGAFSISETNLHLFGKWLAKLLVEYNTITLVPENKSSWPGIQDSLLIEMPKLGEDPGKRIYSTIVDNASIDDYGRKQYTLFTSQSTRNNYYGSYRNNFGFNTNKENRESITGSILQEAAKNTARVVRDSTLIEQLSKLTTKNNRVDHAPGGHDDSVIAWLLAHWFLSYGRNLSHYGIDVSKVKRKVIASKANVSWRDALNKAKEDALRKELAEIMQQYNSETLSSEIVRLERKIESIYEQLKMYSNDNDIASIDNMLSESIKNKTESLKRNIHQNRDPFKNVYNQPIFSRNRNRFSYNGYGGYGSV